MIKIMLNSCTLRENYQIKVKECLLKCKRKKQNKNQKRIKNNKSIFIEVNAKQSTFSAVWTKVLRDSSFLSLKVHTNARGDSI